ncbi:MAG: sigma 54-interacting transcriptional regulator [Lachnospiraceae bacterium]|nr:sigma 54-interacting transcriptional regulator [Lachnospiraceae bacterium]
MRERILKLIEGEDRKNPLTDDEIAVRLGVNRKTVTMNRQEAGIADSRERKRPLLKARIRELMKAIPSMSERELTRRLEEEGFVVGKYVVGRLAEEIRKEYPWMMRRTKEDVTEDEGAKEPGTKVSVAVVAEKPDASVFRNFIGYRGSLMNQISQAQAAVLYPPKGLHCLIYGPSGVGKSYLAELMHSFACGTENFGKNPPYFAFNCADYADNPQLLLAQLFGYNKGSFTGADRDRKGVVELCNGGILFLDEVHRLSPEGQEILFYLMDKGKFRRLGEVDTQRESHLMIIAATTENPQSSLLATFRRRIPMIIEIPSLRERPQEECLEFISNFFWQEASLLGKYIVVKKEVLQYLMSVDYVGNVGQVKSDIKVCCAKAFLESKRRRRETIVVDFACLTGDLKSAHLLDYANRNPRLTQEDMHFYPEGRPGEQRQGEELKNWDIYRILERTYDRLVRAGVSEGEINSRLTAEIETQFSQGIRQIERSRFSGDEMETIVGGEIMKVTRDIYQMARQYFPDLREALLCPLAVHMKMALQRNEGKSRVATRVQGLKERYRKEYEAAAMIWQEISRKYYLSMPEEEIGFLAMYLYRFREHEEIGKNRIRVLVVSHGAVACGMAEVANAVLGTDHAKGLEMNLMDSPAEMTEKVIQAALVLNQGKGIIILADMGSLMLVGDKIRERLGISVGIVGRTDTMMVIEAVRRTLWTDDSLEQIVEALDVKRFAAARETGKRSNKKAVLCLCITGEGSAKMLRDFVEERLKSSLGGVEVLVRGYIEAADVSQIIRKVEESYEILAIVGTIDPEQEVYPFLSLQKVYSGNGLSILRKILKRRQLMEENDLKEVIHSHYISLSSGRRYKDELLDEMIGRLAEDGYVEPGFLLSVYKREGMMTTVLNGGIAIPHGNPEHVRKPVIAVTKLDTPVVWDGINTVDLIFVLALDEKSKKYFEQLYQIISDESMVSALRECMRTEEIYRILCKSTKSDK